MKLFLVTQQKYTEGNFGDLEYGNCATIGVYSTRELAQQAADNVFQDTFHAQYGSAKESCEIQELTLDVLPEKEEAPKEEYHCQECQVVMDVDQPFCSHNCWQEATCS